MYVPDLKAKSNKESVETYNGITHQIRHDVNVQDQ